MQHSSMPPQMSMSAASHSAWRPRLRSDTGCQTCRRRRVKCDEVHPICGRCVKARLRCSWKRETPSNRAKPPRLDITLNVSQAPLFSNWLQKLPTTDTGHRSTVHPELDLEGFQSKICAAYVVNITAQGLNYPLKFDHQLGSLSIHAILAHTSQDEVSTSGLACKAYCLHTFGRRHGLPAVIQQGRMLYNQCLAKLYRTIRGQTNVFETLATISWMGKIENAELTDPTAWVKHELGQLGLISTLDPSVFARNYKALALLECIRPSSVFASIVAHRPTIFETDVWMSVPWSQLPAGKKCVDQQLVDLMLQYLPSTLRQLQSLKQEPDTEKQIDLIRRIWTRYQNALWSLSGWRALNSEQLKTTGLRQLPRASFHSNTFPLGSPLFSTATALLCMSWYYATLTVLHSAAAELCTIAATHRDYGNSVFKKMLTWLLHRDIGVWSSSLDAISGELSEFSDTTELSALWLSFCNNLLEHAHQAAQENCNIIAPVIVGDYEEAVRMYAKMALILGVNTLGPNGLGQWAKRCYWDLLSPGISK